MAKVRGKGNKRAKALAMAGAKARAAKRAPVKRSVMAKVLGARIKDKMLLDVPHYPQTEDFTSSAACAMMVLKFLKPNFKFRREEEYDIWQEAVNGSVWYGSKYGLAYALSKRGASVGIMSNTKDEGYERKMAVYENVNLDTLTASFNEIRQKSEQAGIEEEHREVSTTTIKKALSAGQVPIVLIDAKTINSYLESMPHWVVIKGYDTDNFYINDPYSDSTITIAASAFKAALGYEANYHMVLVNAKPKGK
jgi:hypothetical protein